MVKKHDIQYIRFQTDGTAAKKMEFFRPAAKTRLPEIKKKKARVICLDPLAMIGTVLAAVLLVLMVINCFQISQLQTDTSDMYRYVNDLQAENNRLKDVYNSNVDLDEIPSQALALGMIPTDEAKHITVRLPQNEEMGQSNTQIVLTDGVN